MEASVPSTGSTKTSWPCSAVDYEQVSKIGSGSFSQVWSARCPGQENAMVAIKVMDLENISSSFEDILQEVQTMRLAEDPNILHLYCSFVHSDQLWLVTEFMDKGSCVRLMQIGKSLDLGEGMSEDCVSYILGEVVKGLSYLHNQGQIHRDIKSGNILLNSLGRVKLADFGVSGWTVAKGTRVQAVKTFVGTPCFMAPEVMEQAGGYSFSADIWSLGITALELAKGYAPYAPLPPMRVLIKTIEEEPPTLRAYPHDKQLFEGGPLYSAQFEDFYRRCLQKVPKQVGCWV
jgi:serine/threonine-protein kinase OSR1/STK39